MSTVYDLVRDALLHLRVVPASQTVPAGDMADGIRALNLMMRELEADGLSLGWSDVDAPAATLPLPPEAERAVGYLLAMTLRSQYGTEIDPDLIALATQSEASLRAQVTNQTFARVEYPDLPAGVGRNRGYGWRNGLNG